MKVKWFFSTIITALLITIALFGLASHDSIVAAQGNGNKIEGALLDKFAMDGSADFIVQFSQQADLSAAYAMDWVTRGEFVYNTLADVASNSQINAKVLLDAAGLSYQTFIAGNELYVWSGTQVNAERLAALAEVEYIRATRTYYIDPDVVSNSLDSISWSGDFLANDLLTSVAESPAATTDWGILDTHADQAWLLGARGDGIKVANIDTGVQWNHPALVDQYACTGDPTDPDCWEDPSNICGGSMCDNHGHGTHTMGTMVAKDDPALTYIAGMAPDATWIACKGCESGSCSDYALNTCADWILAPGSDPNNRPNVVNNSWGGGGCDSWYEAKVTAWVAAGIFPAFSSGNSTGCSSMGSPGDYQVSFASTGHNVSRAHAYSQGPSCFGHEPYTKPNITAPAVSVCSTVPTNSWSCGYSGTSMASPHSAGAVAQVWSVCPAYMGQIDATFELLQDYADPPTPPNPGCGVPPDGEGTYEDGYGYLNVLSAVEYCTGGAEDPDIDITPTSLLAEQSPDSITMQQLEICNVGGGTLEWSLEEVPGMKITGISSTRDTTSSPENQAVDETLGVPASDVSAPRGTEVPTGGTLALLDDFNRADGPIGPNWTVHDGYSNVSNNAAVTGNYGRATFNDAPGNGNFAEADVAVNGTSLQYTGLLLDYGAGVNNLFIKVQEQSPYAGQFTNGACYYGNADGSFGLGFFPLDSPFSTAHMAVERVGDTVTIEFTNVDGGAQPDQTYVCNGAPAPEGTGIGIVGYAGIARLDNFGGPGGGGDIPWLSEAPTSGMIDPGMCDIVDVTFDSTGLGAGTYNGSLDVESNDPDTPLVNVPVTLEVITGVPDIVVDPLSLDSILPPDQQETQELNVCNVGDIDLEWELEEAESPDSVLAVLWDNGPLVTHPGDCSGMDASRLQSNLGLNTYGFGNQFIYGYRMADDFTVTDADGWLINQITFFAYQTGAPISPSPITGVYFQIWDGPPDDPGSSVVFGDLVTNRLLSSEVPNLQRDLDTSTCVNSRYIFANVADAGVLLPPGTYWIDWMTDGSLSSGPWAPPITILGETTTGNAMQYTTAWAPALDTGTSTQQGMPFIIEGEIPGGYDIPWLSEDPISGTVPAGECQVVDATFDSTGLELGSYFGVLNVLSNDPDTPEVQVDVSLTVIAPIPVVDLSVVKTASADEVLVGDVFTYTLVVSNAGPDDAVGVTLTDTLPALVSFVSASEGCSEEAGVVTCDIGDLDMEDSVTLYIVATADAEGVATNVAEVPVPPDYEDPNPANNMDQVETLINPAFSSFYLPLVQKH